MATPEENQKDTHLKIECQMYFSENLPGVNPVVTNYKIRHNKNWPVRYSLVWPDHFFCYHLWWQKNKKMIWTCEAKCEGGHGGRLAQYVS